MPIMKGSEGPQKPSPTLGGARHIRTSSSDSDPIHRRPMTESSPRLRNYQSPKSSQSDPLKPKKLGTRITDLETQLVQAQHELKSLKHQLSSAEAAKKKAQEELHKKGTKKQTVTKKAVGRAKPTTAAVAAVQKNKSSRDKPGDDTSEEDLGTDVFEVPVEKMLVEPEVELSHCSVDDDTKENNKLIDSSISEPEKPSLSDELASRNEEIEKMRAMLEEKEKEIHGVVELNEILKKQLDEAKSEIELGRKKEEEIVSKVNQLEQNIEVSREKESQLKEKLVEAEAAKELLETEMKKMKVQTEQWRKAADAAASVLAGGVEKKGRISDRCVSMDNHFNSIFEAPPITGFGGYHGSPGAGDDEDDSFGVGKKKGSGIRMLGDLWKKKGHK